MSKEVLDIRVVTDSENPEVPKTLSTTNGPVHFFDLHMPGRVAYDGVYQQVQAHIANAGYRSITGLEFAEFKKRHEGEFPGRNWVAWGMMTYYMMQGDIARILVLPVV